MLGQKVQTVASAAFSAGPNAVRFDTGQLASGVYIVRLTAGDRVATQRMTVVR